MTFDDEHESCDCRQFLSHVAFSVIQLRHLSDAHLLRRTQVLRDSPQSPSPCNTCYAFFARYRVMFRVSSGSIVLFSTSVGAQLMTFNPSACIGGGIGVRLRP
uniref:Uncharacterized protein n=1 Tax=Toxoplasma gondii (strain ATCC 50861 / VEG) TaxID=432359 RepID=A0A0F7V0N8_TOXGV|nr:TPA: hypothetical protein BN1205_024430 [Toxoplasma gondii VEG]